MFNIPKTISADLPIEQIRRGVKNVPALNFQYKLVASNDIFSQYTLEYSEYQVPVLYADISLNAVAEDKTELTISVRGVRHANPSMTSSGLITSIINYTTTLLTLTDEQIAELRLKTVKQKKNSNEQKTLMLLCAFLGVFGVHRFHSGHTGIGVLQLLTFGGCGIWTLIDFIMIATDSFKDAEGNLITSK